jgi:hypothetical protein
MMACGYAPWGICLPLMQYVLKFREADDEEAERDLLFNEVNAL